MLNQVLFRDRLHAGRVCAEQLTSYRGKHPLVLGIARGGVVVASVIAQSLNADCDVLIVKKISSELTPEFALGAVAPDGVSVVHWADAHRAGEDEHVMHQRIMTLGRTIRLLNRRYRKGKKPLVADGKTVIIADDGAATGATMEAAISWARAKHAHEIVVVLPVAPPGVVDQLTPECDRCIVIHADDGFRAVGQYYAAFPQVEDREVIQYIHPHRPEKQL